MKMKLLIGVIVLSVVTVLVWPLISSISYGHSHAKVRTYNKSIAIAVAYQNWMNEYGERPPTSDKPMVDILNQGGPKQIKFLSDRDVEDTWGTRFRVYIGEGEMVVWSAGRDRKFSEDLREDDDLLFVQTIK